MKVLQIAELMNNVSGEILGQTDLFTEDLSNVVTAGRTLLDSADVNDIFKSLVNHVGKMVFVNRPYMGGAPKLLMSSWEFGSILEKISFELPEAEENESWALQDGASYDQQIFYKPEITVKYYNDKVTFEFHRSIMSYQINDSFGSAEQLNSFVSALYNAVDKAMTANIDSLIMRTINALVAETIHADYPAGNYGNTSGVKAVNLLKLYNDKFGTNLSAADSITNAEFNRFAAYMMGLYITRLSKLSRLFNVGGKDRFTPKEYLHVVMLADFAKAADAYLQSDTFHNEYTALPSDNLSIVPYWQGSGQNYDFADTSKIDIKTPSGNTVTVSGVLGVMFDREAAAVNNQNRRTTTAYNAKAEFQNVYFKWDCQNIIDTNENCVVFFVA